MLFCKGHRAVVFVVLVAGLLFRANAELYPGLSIDTFPASAQSNAVSSIDFSLVNHYTETQSLGSSNLPSLLANIPAQDLFTYSSSLEAQSEAIAPKDSVPAWDSLWNNASRISIAAVPEPSSLAMLIAGALLLGAGKNLRGRK